MARRYTMDRRAYLRTVGAAGLATGLAGCLGGDDGGDGNGGSDSPAPTETGTPTPVPETEITAGTAPGFPPFELLNEQNELVGFDIDLLEAVVAAADGYALSGWKEFEFSSLIPALTSDNIDTIAAAMTITDKRDETIDFTNPYWSADQAIIVREGEADQYSELSDLSGHPVGAQSGTTGESVVQDQLIAKGELKESNYKSFGNYVLAVQALVNGDIDAVVVDTPVAQTFAAQRPVEIAFVYETGEHYGFGVRNNDDDLLTALNQGLETVRNNGTYEELTNKWFGQG